MIDWDATGGGRMTLLEHLEELRQRLLRSAIAVVIAMAIGWWLAPRVLEWLIHETVGTASVLSPLEGFGERFRLSFTLGVVMALPAVLYQAWAFVVPGLLRRERHLLLPLVGGSLLLFAAGGAMALWLVVPIALEALQSFLTPSMQPEYRLSYVLGFVYNLVLATGIVFQLPLVVGALTSMRVLSTRFLVRRWRVAIVAAVAVSALITPGDVVIAQLLLGIPLVALYLLSIGVAWMVERTRAPGESALLDRFTEDDAAEGAGDGR
ncbi:MAG: twin-arginine translocase subunit TatC [Thermoanaerobaculia bacterium]|nr:twin-arginine translocase subunit TatC [Thermoanaerobaculia bacterium]